MALDPGTIRETERFGMPEGKPEMITCACGCDTIIKKDEAVYCEVCHKFFCDDCGTENILDGYWICWDCLNKAVDTLAEVKQLREKYGGYEQLWKIAEQDNCEETCDTNYPYKRCPECMAKNAINECGEIRDIAIRGIEQVLKGEQ